MLTRPGFLFQKDQLCRRDALKELMGCRQPDNAAANDGYRAAAHLLDRFSGAIERSHRDIHLCSE
jgi:hypothetical protein